MACANCESKVNLPLWSPGSTTTSEYVMSDKIIDAAKYQSFCVDVETRNGTGDMVIQRCVRYSADGYIWDSPTSFDGWIASEGFDYGSSYTSIPDGKNYVWFGMETKNATATDVEQGRTILTIKLQQR